MHSSNAEVSYTLLKIKLYTGVALPLRNINRAPASSIWLGGKLVGSTAKQSGPRLSTPPPRVFGHIESSNDFFAGPFSNGQGSFGIHPWVSEVDLIDLFLHNGHNERFVRRSHSMLPCSENHL